MSAKRFTAPVPYNVNTQNIRTRFWDGQDHMLRDDVSSLKGNHLFQFGGTYQHNYDYHQRSDNGGGINYQPVYQLGTTAGSGISGERRASRASRGLPEDNQIAGRAARATTTSLSATTRFMPAPRRRL